MAVSSSAFDLDEWDATVGRMIRHHDNIQREVASLVQQIRKEMKPELVPVAEEKANYGKAIKKSIRDMWALEYEIAEIQDEFAHSCLGKVDVNSLTDDIVEDIMLQSKPLQVILKSIRDRQSVRLHEIKQQYEDKIHDLEPMKMARPPKTAKSDPPKDAEAKKEEAPSNEAPLAPAPAIEVTPEVQVSA